MMMYRHRFRVRAPLATVAAFHARSNSMAAITPPPIIVRAAPAPVVLGSGDRLDFTLWLGPLPVRWVAQIDNATQEGFTDRQIRGPFAQWIHRHSYRSLDGDVTEVRDQVQASLRQHPFWGPVGLAMWIGMPLLFAYRGWRTRRLLETSRPMRTERKLPKK